MDQVQVKLEFTSVWEVPEGRDHDEVRAEVFELMRAYLTRRDSVLFGDYGENAWGGWEGPKIVKAGVTRVQAP